MMTAAAAGTPARGAGTWRRRAALRPPAVLLLLLFTAGAAVGAAPQPAGYWTGDVDAPTPAAIDGGRVIHARALEALIKGGAVAVIDASNAPRRPDGMAPGAPWLPVPHQALPGAVWIPEAGAGEIRPEVDQLYRTVLQRATVGDLEAPVVVYCHDKCWLSWNAAKRAIAYGYRRVAWFPEGIEGWTAAGLPTAVVEPQRPAPDPAAAVTGGPAADAARGPRPKLVVLDLELTGDLGGPAFAAEHAARLAKESARLREDLERTGMYRIVDDAPARPLIDRLRSEQAYLHDCNGCDLEVGRQLQADRVFVAWVDRVSGLILSLTYEIHDVKTSQILARKSFDFRGDNDTAWNHAIDYMVRDLKAAGAP